MHRRLLSAIGLIALVLALPDAALGAELRACTIDRVEGDDARYWSAGVWSEAVAGSALTADAKVVTGVDTRVSIVCDNDTVVAIGTETELNLENLAGAGGSDDSVAMQLIEGILGLLLPRRTHGGFEVRTPVAIASVRSTEWLIEWHAGDAAAVFVRSGRVGVRTPAGERFALAEGDGVTISAAGVAGEVKQWGAARIAKSAERLGLDWR